MIATFRSGVRQDEDVRHPYPALVSFDDTDLDRSLFFGREQEAEILLNRVLTSDLVLLFGRSGYGKTSLIKAGVMEPLRRQHYFPVVCKLTHSFGETPLETIRSRVLEVANAEGVDVKYPDDCESLWEFFFQGAFTKDEHLLRPVLILDQFEELFSRIGVEQQWGPEWQQRFVRELSDLVRRRVPENLKDTCLDKVENLPADNDERRRWVDCLYGSGGPDVKVLIAIREDFLAELEALRMQIPAIFSNAFRLEPLTAEAARLAITKPAARAASVGMEPFSFEKRALDEMLNFLSLDKRTRKPRSGACIEPTQLQILCYDLSVRRLRSGAKIITAHDLRGVRGMRRIIRFFYRRMLRRFPRLRLGWSGRAWWPSVTNFLLFHRPRKSIGQLCEYGLITASGYRDSLILDSIQGRFGVRKQDLDKLVNLRLLRAEPRLGAVFYELAHDTLVDPLRTIRRNRRLLRLAIIGGVIFVPLTFGLIDIFKQSETYYAQRTLNLAKANPVTGVNVSGLNLARTDLKGARFDNSNFRETDLRDVDAQGAIFRNSDFENAKVTGMNIIGARFDGSDWWMAMGWSDEQIKTLKLQHPVTINVQSPRYSNRVSDLSARVSDATGKEKAIPLNDIAWYRATNGTDLLTAYQEITEAFNIGEPTFRFFYLDTRAYIRLQLHENSAAVTDLEEADTLDKKRGSPIPESGTMYYHLGLAYEGVGDRAKAGQAFARAEELGYQPTYERVLTPRREGALRSAVRASSRNSSEYLELLAN